MYHRVAQRSLRSVSPRARGHDYHREHQEHVETRTAIPVLPIAPLQSLSFDFFFANGAHESGSQVYGQHWRSDLSNIELLCHPM